jgi:hypothetical protein
MGGGEDVGGHEDDVFVFALLTLPNGHLASGSGDNCKVLQACSAQKACWAKPTIEDDDISKRSARANMPRC